MIIVQTQVSCDNCGIMLSKLSSILKKGGFACKWLGNADMHMSAKFDQNSLLGNEFDFWKVHGIINTSGLLQSK